MAALLVMIGVMAVVMAVAMPVWRHEAQREKEEELVFRGLQYQRAIGLYSRKLSSYPPGVDVLVQGRYLRKKYKDPITNQDFDVIAVGGQAGQGLGSGSGPGVSGQPGGAPGLSGARGQTAGRGGAVPLSGSATPSPSSAGGTPSGSAFGQGLQGGGLAGVRSKSKDESIRLYQGRNHYNEWNFIYANASTRPGGVGGPFGPGGRGGPNGPGVPNGPGPGGRGTSPPFGPRGNPFPVGPGRGPGGGGGGGGQD